MVSLRLPVSMIDGRESQPVHKDIIKSRLLIPLMGKYTCERSLVLARGAMEAYWCKNLVIFRQKNRASVDLHEE